MHCHAAMCSQAAQGLLAVCHEECRVVVLVTEHNGVHYQPGALSVFVTTIPSSWKRTQRGLVCAMHVARHAADGPECHMGVVAVKSGESQSISTQCII